MADSTELTEANESLLKTAVNPASFESESLFIKEILKANNITIETVMAATIISYNRTTGIAEVQPLVKRVYNTTEGDKYKTREPVSVHVLRMQHGMFWVDSPLYPGDTGYLVAGHRDQSLAVGANSSDVLVPERMTTSVSDNGTVTTTELDVKTRTNNQGPQPPNTYLLHRYENGFFIPCRWGSIAVDEADKDSLIIARLKEDEDAAKGTPPVYQTDGTVGKITFDKTGNVEIANESGLTIQSTVEHTHTDEYTNSSGDVETETTTAKPKVVIDPTADLDVTDAKFRVVEFPVGGKAKIDSRGYYHFPTRKLRILADDCSESGSDILIQLLNKSGNVVDTATKNNTYNSSMYASTTDDSDSETSDSGSSTTDKGGENYCNSISDDGSGEDDDGNDISYTPCEG